MIPKRGETNEVNSMIAPVSCLGIEFAVEIFQQKKFPDSDDFTEFLQIRKKEIIQILFNLC